MKITCFAAGVVSGIISIIWLAIGQLVVFNSGMADMVVAWCLPFAVCFLIVLFFLRYFMLTEKGIQHKLFGICYRRTPWDRIYKIRVYRPRKGDTEKHFGVFAQGKHEKQIEENLHSKKVGIRGWLAGEFFLITCSLKKKQEMLSYINAHSKSIEYEYFSAWD